MMVKARRGFLVLMLGLLAGALGCADEAPLPQGGPVVVELSKSSLVLGESLFLYGRGFAKEDSERTRLTFVGTFFGDDGSEAEVNFSIFGLEDGVTNDAEQLDVARWSRFGPFENPFGVNTTGVFRGSIFATVVRADGTEVRGPASRSFSLAVEPSLAIERLEPILADCGAPALRGLGGLPYEMTVRAVGFTPTLFRYEITNINGAHQDDVTVFEHVAGGPSDTLGADEPFVFNPVDKLVEEQGRVLASYVSQIRVVATDAKGQEVETVLPFSVHRPMEVFFSGKREVAEYLEPVPVTGCIPGSIGNSVSYSEQKSESRQYSLSITVATDWSRSNGTSNDVSWQEGYGEGVTTSTSNSQSISLSEGRSTSESYGVSYDSAQSNSVGFDSSDGESWSWDFTEGVTDEESLSRSQELSAEAGLSTTVTLGAEGSIPGFAKASGSVSTQGSVSVGASTGTSQGRSHSNSRSQGFSASGSRNSSQSFGSTTTDSMGQSIDNSYTLSSDISQSHDVTDAVARDRSRTYSLGGSDSTSEVVSVGRSEAENQTWSESTTFTSTVELSSVIPVGKFAVFYRQTTRYVKRAQVRTYDLCGVSEVQGEMYLNEWSWAPGLAVGDTCGAELPPSNLPQAQCFIAPCVE
jgi:hypothetical protein